MRTIDLVYEFHQVFHRPINTKPVLGDVENNLLRVRLLREEVSELEEALAERDEAAVLDALTDIQYILDGSYLSLGLANLKEIAFAEVHKANMRKLGPDGKPIIRADGKIIKPEGWIPPDLTPLFR